MYDFSHNRNSRLQSNPLRNPWRVFYCAKMPKYNVKLPHKLYLDDGEWASMGDYAPQSMTVHEAEKSFATGLFDAHGNEYYRVRNPIGFDLNSGVGMKKKGGKGGKKC